MSLLLAEDASSICYRCLFRRHVSIRGTLGRASRRAFTTEATPLAESEETTSRPKRARHEAKSWTSMLKTQSLGKPRSVLVMRDANTTDLATQYASYVQDLGGGASIDDLVKSMEAQKATPGQEDVNEAVDKMVRSAFSTGLDARQRILSEEAFVGLVNSLTESFNKVQLNGYHLIHATAQLIEKGAPKKAYEWIPRPIPKRFDLPGQKKKTSGQIKARRHLARTILQDVWLIRTHEDMDRRGRLELRLDGRDPLQQLLRPESLRQIARDFDVEMAFSSPTKTRKKDDNTGLGHSRVVITGLQGPAEQAAERILSINENMTSIDVSLKGLMALSPLREAHLKQAVYSAIEATGCSFQVTAEDGHIKIHCPDPASEAKCYRAIYAATDITASNQKSWVATPHNRFGHERGLYPSEFRHGIWFERPVGRLRTSTPLHSGGSSRARETVQQPLEPEQWAEIQAWLKLHHGSGRLVARFGQLGRRMNIAQLPAFAKLKADNPEQAETMQDQLRSVEDDVVGVIDELLDPPVPGPKGKLDGMINETTAESKRRLKAGLEASTVQAFQSTSTGIANVVMDHVRNQQPKLGVSVRVSLVPSPFTEQSTTNGPSHLSATFSPDTYSKTLRFQSLDIMREAKSANIHLPELVGDVRIEALDEVKVLRETDADALASSGGFQALVENIEQSGRGFATISPPPFIDLPTSLWNEYMPGDGTGSSPYLVSEVEFLEQLRFTIDGIALTYTRGSSSDASGQTDRLELHMGAIAAPGLESQEPYSPEQWDIYSAALHKILASINRNNRQRKFLEELKPREMPASERINSEPVVEGAA